MSKSYFNTRFGFVFIGILVTVNVLHAQTIEYLNSNNVRAGIGVGGNLFTNAVDSPKVYDLFELPKGHGVDAIFTQALWITAMDATDSLRCAANRYFDYGQDFFDGPVAATYDSVYDSYYKRVWKVTKGQINQFRSLAFPTTAGLVDPAILHWPGKGNASVLNDYGVNIGTALAPFVDLNGNGIYEPLLGDYPGICGDEGIFFVYNDIRKIHTQTFGRPLGVEVRGMASSFTDSTTDLPYAKRAINNTVIVQYELENKSANDYHLLDVAMWVDADLGCYDNDRTGCDTTRGLIFQYNGVANDPSCSPENGYNNLPIAVGVKTLNQPMNVAGYFNGIGSNAPTPDPVEAYQYRNYSEGFWEDSTPFTYGGLGFNGMDTVKFLFTGNPNIPTDWTDIQPWHYPGERKMFSSSDYQNFPSGAIKHYDYAFFTSFDSTSQYLSIVDTLKRDADIINSFYYNNIVPCQTQFTLGIQPVIPDDVFSVMVYPNPAHNIVTIETDDRIEAFELMDIEGRILRRETIGAKMITLPVSDLAKGIYLLNVIHQGRSYIRKFVIN